MAADHPEFPDGRDTESNRRADQMEGSVVRDSQQVDPAERGRSGRHMRLDHGHHRGPLLEGAKGGQDREAAGSAQVPLRRDVKRMRR